MKKNSTNCLSIVVMIVCAIAYIVIVLFYIKSNCSIAKGIEPLYSELIIPSLVSLVIPLLGVVIHKKKTNKVFNIIAAVIFAIIVCVLINMALNANANTLDSVLSIIVICLAPGLLIAELLELSNRNDD